MWCIGEGRPIKLRVMRYKVTLGQCTRRLLSMSREDLDGWKKRTSSSTSFELAPKHTTTLVSRAHSKFSKKHRCYDLTISKPFTIMTRLHAWDASQVTRSRPAGVL